MLDKINDRLKAGKTGVRVLQRGDRLYLVATLPPKPGSGKDRSFQQQISLGIRANRWGLAEAEGLALELAADLARDRFDWGDWVRARNSQPLGETCQDWLERYWRYINESVLTGSQESKDYLWRKRYYCYLQRLPMAEKLTTEAVITALSYYSPSSRSRQVAAAVLDKFAKWCGVTCDLKDYRGNYNPSNILRIIPSDAEIVAAVSAVPNLKWRRVLALMAVYGLRNHECWGCSLEWVEVPNFGEILRCSVQGGKTGSRSALPLPPDWVELWGLGDDQPLPVLKVRSNEQYGEKSSSAIREYGIGFPPYSLRHSYALRGTVRYKLPIPVMASMMGHSPELHLRIYNKHLTADQSLAAYSDFLDNYKKV